MERPSWKLRVVAGQPARHPAGEVLMAQASTRLQDYPPELPRDADLSPDWFAREMATAFSQNRVMVRFLADLPPTIL